MAATPVAAPLRKPWCGEPGCNERTRQIEVGDDHRPAPCPRCHRLSKRSGDQPEKPTCSAHPTAPPRRSSRNIRRDAQERDPVWWAAAWAVVKVLAAEGRPFTSDDLRQSRFGLGEPASSSAWGAVIAAARSAGLIEKVGHRSSAVPSRHGATVGTWIGTGRRET